MTQAPPDTSTTPLPGAPAVEPLRLPRRIADLYVPVDIASIAFFRVCFGLLMMWDCWRHLAYGWVREYWIEQDYHFTYMFFHWVRPWPGEGMIWHFVALMTLAGIIASGFFYRVAAALFFLGWSYVVLLDKTHLQNHFYLIALLSFLLIFIPAHRAWSVDAWMRRCVRSEYTPAWALWLLRFQVALPYFFGGVAKITYDWLIVGEPARTFLKETQFRPIRVLIHRGGDETLELMTCLMSWSGMLFDLLIVPALLWRKTRWLAIGAALLFHLTNSQVFRIGVFPWMMIPATLMFCEPGWPRKVFGWLFTFLDESPPAITDHDRRLAAPGGALWRNVGLACMGAYVLVQLVLPLRHYAYPGDVNWTGEGRRFAWRMRLNTHKARGQVWATDPDVPRTWEVDPGQYITPQQQRMVWSSPDMALSLAHLIADDLRAAGHPNVEVRMKIARSVNLRQQQLLIDPDRDLASVDESPPPADWVLPWEVDVSERLDESVMLFPYSSFEYYNEAMRILEHGQRNVAAQLLNRALELEPSNARAHNALGELYAIAGRSNEAIRSFREAILHAPGWPEPRLGLATALLTHRDESARNAWEAIQQAQIALDLTDGPDPKARATLAAALAADNQFDRAVDEARLALTLARRGSDQKTIAAIETMLKDIESKQRESHENGL